MAKFKKGWLVELWFWVVGVFVALAVGGSFIAGNYETVTILKWFPSVIHNIVGWTIDLSVIVGIIARIANKI